MYKGKPLVAGSTPWWRHHSLPWGWYSMGEIKANKGDTLHTDGYLVPKDGGDNVYAVANIDASTPDGGAIIDIGDKVCRAQFDATLKPEQFGAIKDED